jgi:CcmD family protein
MQLMNRFNKWLYLGLLLPATSMAQEPAMADVMRQDGKIYVVVAVILIIFVVLAVYLFYLDRKISALENKK